MTDDMEVSALEQIEKICNHPKFKDSKLVVMPDVHESAGCVVMKHICVGYG